MTDAEPKSMWQQITGWAVSQPFNNLMTAAFFVGAAVFAHYSVTRLVPDTLGTIQRGYEQLDTRHREERVEMREQFAEWLDRYDKRGHAVRDFGHPVAETDSKQQ